MPIACARERRGPRPSSGSYRTSRTETARQARPRPRFGNSNGVALVVVLFAVALVSIVVLAYFNLAMMNRNISFSSAGQARANILALSSLNFIKGDLISEIQAGSTQEPDSTGSGVPIYLPTTNITMVPYRMTATITPVDSTVPYNLVKWSSSTVPFWTNSAAYSNTNGPIRAAAASTATASMNGHFIGNSRWTTPRFNISTVFPTKVVPEWVYMTRQGPLTNNTTPVAMLANSAATNSSYVIGRYAYTIYDEGGLLDVTAAGYSPSSFTSANDPTDVGRKGSQGFADLTQLGLTTAQADQFVTWRNAATASSAVSYVNYLTTNAPASGFLQPATGDQAFLSRQDLIQYWTSELGASTTNLPYITTFSREKNAPSWGPEHDANDPNNLTYWNGSNTDTAYDAVTLATNDPPGGISYAYHTSQDVKSSDNRFFPNVRVKTAFTRLSKEPAVVGEPLVKNRFDLSKLAWISYTGVPPTGVTYQDIYNYFGLIPNFSAGGTFLSWTYNHTSLTAPSPSNGTLATDTSSIMTLDQIASLPPALAREPDFFEILQATILRGSLGLCSGDPTQAKVDLDNGTGGEFYRAAVSNPAYPPLDSGGALYRPVNSDTSAILHVVNAQSMYQIIQIGANIIDQADTDNFPTEIILNGDHFYGVENLPYISGIGDAALRVAPVSPPSASPPAFAAMPYDITSSPPPDNTISGKTQYQAYVHRWLEFALWNPHQNANNPPTVGPTKIRISVAHGQEYPYIAGLGNFPPSKVVPVGGTDYSGRWFQPPGSAVTVPSAGSPQYAEGPAWIEMKLNEYPNYFAEPTAIDYTHSYTSDTDSTLDAGNLNINDPDGRIQTSHGWQRAGIYLGWSYSPDNPYKVPACAPLYPNWATKIITPSVTAVAGVPVQFTIPLTIWLQYEDTTSAGTWHTYQELDNLNYSRVTKGGGDAFMEPGDTSWNEWLTAVPPSAGGTGDTVSRTINGTGVPTTFNGAMLTNMDSTVVIPIDPRTSRLNFFTLHNGVTWGNPAATGTDAMVTSTVPMVVEPSKGFSSGPHYQDPSNAGNAAWPSFAKTWVDNISVPPMKNYDQTGTTTYYRDRDYITRVGDAAGWGNVVLPSDALAADPKGASPLTTSAQMQRPFHLDRPFRSVAELGYVFRDDPWKTLNLISANSADSGLLDVFCIGSSSTSTPNAPAPDVVAGKMNINSAALNILATGTTTLTSLPLQALVSQALRDYKTPSSDPMTLDTAITAASDMKSLSTNIVNYVKINGPFVNLGDLPALYPQVTASSPPVPLYTGLKNPSEALIRSLADSSSTRTWNLMIDVIAQAGKFNSTVANFNNFTVEGEKHYWLHVAIDRFTGEIVDQQIEPVWE